MKSKLEEFVGFLEEDNVTYAYHKGAWAYKVLVKARALLAAEKAAMKTDKTGLEQIIEWAKKEHEYLANVDRSCDMWCKEVIVTTKMEVYDKVLDKARALLAAEKAAMEKAQKPLCKVDPSFLCDELTAQKPLAHASLGSLLIWVDNEPEKLNKTVLKYKLVAILANTYRPEKPTADKGLWEKLNDLYEKSLYHPELALRVIGSFDVKDLLLKFKPIEPSPDLQTQVQQLIQWAKDNGYELAAEWMVDNKIAFLTDEQLQSLSERFGCFQFGDAQGDKSRDFANAVIELSRHAHDKDKENME